MLFTDGTILSLQDLRDHDNFVLEVASTESIELSSKMAIAQRAVGYELSSYLANRETPIALNRVLVNDELRDLVALQTLAAVYADAYNRHLNDRYLGRLKDLRQAGDRSFQRLLQNGVGIAGTAVARADKPVVGAAAQGTLPGGYYSVQIAWEHVGGAIGERSEEVTVDCPGGGIEVLRPAAPVNMAGWHVFIGSADIKVARQNPLPIGEASWMQATPLRTDLPGLQPSGPDYFVRLATQMVRR